MAIKANIVIDQGADFATTINLTDEDGDIIDLTDFTGAAQMRKHYTSVTAYEFTVNISEASGEVTLSMTANTTDNIPAGRYVYDCELTDDNGVKSRIVEGIVTVTPGVTR